MIKNADRYGGTCINLGCLRRLNNPAKSHIMSVLMGFVEKGIGLTYELNHGYCSYLLPLYLTHMTTVYTRHNEDVYVQ